MSTSSEVSGNVRAEATLSSVIARVAAAMRDHLGTGQLAELRRISPRDPFTPALWKLLLTYVPGGWTGGRDRDEKERRWAAVFMGMALAGGRHDPGVRFGRALAEAGWSELRLVRLLRERGDGLAEAVRRLAQYLNAKAQPADWAGAARLLLHQEDDAARTVRQGIARSYYREKFRQERKLND